MSLLARFEEQVVRRPEAVAIRSGDQELTYAELWRAGGDYGDWLRSNGVRPGQLIGIEVGRRVSTVCALIGALRTRAPYLPMLTSWPRERRRLLLRAASVDLVCSDDMTAVVHEDSQQHPTTEGTGLLYVLYTSGTTGTPKGVAISDSNVSSMLDAALARFDLTDRDVWAMAHLATFDFSVWEMWGALTTGARIEMLTDQEVTQPHRLRTRISTSGVTVLSQVPSSFNAAAKEHADALRNDEYRSLRYVVFGGEQAKLGDASDIVTLSRGRVAPINMYGITECSVHATFCALTPDRLATWADSACTPIGTPLASHRVMLTDARVDDDGSEIGELMISGPAVSSGYWRDDELNGTRFVPDEGAPPTVWFKTGDIVRRLPDGELAYVERRDSQVKVMGYRIDLTEIERNVMSLDAMVACAAYVTRHGRRDKLALAYVSRLEIRPPTIADHLRRVLPAYMVPTLIRPLEVLPLTESGKVDRAAIARQPTSSRPQPCA